MNAALMPRRSCQSWVVSITYNRRSSRQPGQAMAGQSSAYLLSFRELVHQEASFHALTVICISMMPSMYCANSVISSRLSDGYQHYCTSSCRRLQPRRHAPFLYIADAKWSIRLGVCRVDNQSDVVYFSSVSRVISVMGVPYWVFIARDVQSRCPQGRLPGAPLLCQSSARAMNSSVR